MLAAKRISQRFITRSRRCWTKRSSTGFDGMRHDTFQSVDGDHGRIETRRIWMTDEVHWLGEELLGNWKGLASIAAVECQRQDIASSRSSINAAASSAAAGTSTPRPMAAAVRGHWAVVRINCTGSWT